MVQVWKQHCWPPFASGASEQSASTNCVLQLCPLVADLECCINVISHLVPRLPPHQTQTAAKQIASALTSSVSNPLGYTS